MNDLTTAAVERLTAQLGEALFGEPSLSLMDIANRRAEIEQMAKDTARIEWLEATARHYGDGHNEPHEAIVGFDWQQSKDCLTYPGIRPAIDAAMKEQAE